MRRWLWISVGLLAIGYFGSVRESEARLLRRCRSAYCVQYVPPPCHVDPCDPRVLAQPAPPLADSTFKPVDPPPVVPVPPVNPPVMPPDKPPVVPVVPNDPPVKPVVPPVTPVDPSVKPVVPPVKPVDPPVAAVIGDRVIALVIADDAKDDTGAASRAGAKLMADLLKVGVTPDKLAAVTRLGGADLSADKVLSAIDKLAIKPGDALVCLYTGAGQYDETAQDFVLSPGNSDAKLPRARLRTALVAKKARLTVLLTDPLSNRVQPETPPAPLTVPTTGVALDKLFFGYKGIVDVQACSSTEYAFPRGDTGGIFTLAFVRELSKRSDPASEVGWGELLENVKTETRALYEEFRADVLMSGDAVKAADKAVLRRQTAQTPMLPTPIDQVLPVPAEIKPAPKPPEEKPKEKPTKSAEATLPVPTLELTVAEPAPAELVVKLPTDASLMIDGQPSQQRAGERRFTTPPLVPGKSYAYTVRVEAVRDGQPRSETRLVSVTAGAVIVAEFTEESLATLAVRE